MLLKQLFLKLAVTNGRVMMCGRQKIQQLLIIIYTTIINSIYKRKQVIIVLMNISATPTNLCLTPTEHSAGGIMNTWPKTSALLQ